MTRPRHPLEDNPEDDGDQLWRMMEASYRAKRDRQRSLAIGCLAPAILILVALFALAIGGARAPHRIGLMEPPAALTLIPG